MEIKIKQNDIVYQIPQVDFPYWETYMEQAGQIADYIKGISVTEDNIKEAKEILAKARTATDRFDRIRIDAKKEILKNYTEFERQIKDIVKIIDDADRELREKVNKLDEIEREEKKKDIFNIWERRICHYPEITKLIPDAFNKWFSPRYANKSFSIKKIESEMSDWMELQSNNIEGAEALGDEYLTEYLKTLNFSEAVKAVDRQKEINERIKTTRVNQDEPEETKAIFIVKSEKDIALTELLLKSNNIEYERK